MLAGKMTSRATTSSAEDHRKFNRHGEAFDRGETFSGVDYETGLKTVEALRKLAATGHDAAPTGAAMDSVLLRRDLHHPRRETPFASGGERRGGAASAAFAGNHGADPETVRRKNPRLGASILVSRTTLAAKPFRLHGDWRVRIRYPAYPKLGTPISRISFAPDKFPPHNSRTDIRIIGNRRVAALIKTTG